MHIHVCLICLIFYLCNCNPDRFLRVLGSRHIYIKRFIEAGMSIWRQMCHWQHRKLWKWHRLEQLMTTMSLKWQNSPWEEYLIWWWIIIQFVANTQKIHGVHSITLALLGVTCMKFLCDIFYVYNLWIAFYQSYINISSQRYSACAEFITLGSSQTHLIYNFFPVFYHGAQCDLEVFQKGLRALKTKSG